MRRVQERAANRYQRRPQRSAIVPNRPTPRPVIRRLLAPLARTLRAVPAWPNRYFGYASNVADWPRLCGDAPSHLEVPMMKRILMAIAVAVIGGIVAGLFVGQRVGMSIGLLIGVLAVVFVVLTRNQKDLDELQHGHVPDPVNRALGEEDE